MDYKQTQRNNSKYKTQLCKKATKEELIFKEYLDSVSIRYIFQTKRISKTLS